MARQKIPVQTGLKALWRHLRPFKKQLIILSTLGLISAIANGFVPYVTGRFFDALIGVSQGSVESIGALPLWAFLLGAWALVQFIANNIDWIIDRLRRKVDTKLHLAIQVSGFIHLFRLPLSFHKNTRINETIERFSKAGWQSSHILRTVIEITPQFLSIIIGIALVASINGILAFALIVGVALYSLLLVRILAPAASASETAHRAWNEGWGDAAAAVHQIETVKQAASEDSETLKTKAALSDRAYGLWYRVERIWNNVNFFQRTIVFATQFTVFLLSVYFIASGTLTVGELVAVNGYALMFFGPFVSLGHSWQWIQNGLIAAAQAEEVLAEEAEVYLPKDGASFSIKGEVYFKNVTFQYALHEPPVLKNVTFSVSSGEVIALVGASGVGKSTVVSLISGYYFPSTGSVRIDGVDTGAWNLTALRKQIGVVPQEVALFNDTVKENIRYGIADARQKDIERAAREAHAEEFVLSFPQQYKTLVGERGVKLSVGQKQRIAIARAILRNPKILILDEPTSALDAKTEQYVSEALERLMKGRTTFIVAHRLSTVRKADTIFVFEKGTIVESGKHKDLITRKNGVYRRLHDYQVGLF